MISLSFLSVIQEECHAGIEAGRVYCGLISAYSAGVIRKSRVTSCFCRGLIFAVPQNEERNKHN
jgi:hypothetical protein